MKRSADSAKVWSRELKDVGRQASQVGAALSKTLTLPILAAAAALVKVGVDFDKASDTIRTATGATGKDLDKLNTSFKNVFATVPDSVEHVSAAIGDLSVRTGQTGKGLELLTTQMLNLARVGKADIGALTAATTRAFGDWSIATNKQSAALDFLFKTSQATGIGVTRLTELVVQFGAPMRALGFSFEESAVLMGKWEKEGVNLETVLSGLRFALGNFAKAGKEPAEALKQVQEAILGAKTEADATAIAFQTFGKRAAVDMSRAIIEGRFSIDELVKSLKASKETINSAADDTKSLSERFLELKNKVSVALEPISRPLMSALENAVKAAQPLIAALGGLAEMFAALPSGVHVAVFAIAGLVAAIGPLLFVFGQIVISTSAVIGAFGAKGIAMRALAANTHGLTASLVGLRTAIAGVLVGPLAIALVGVGGAALYAAVEIRKLKEQTRLWMQTHQDARTIQEIYDKIRTGVALTAEEVTRYREALERQNQSIDRSRVAFQGLGADYKGFTVDTETLTAAQAKRLTLSEAIAQADQKIRDEIKDTKLTLGQLTQALNQNEEAFKAWAKENGLSAETIKFLEAQLQKQKKAQDAAGKSAEALTKDVEGQRKALEALGLITLPNVNTQFGELNELWSRAVADGVPLVKVTNLLGPAYQDLADKAAKAGIAHKGLNEQLALMRSLLPAAPTFNVPIIAGFPPGMLAGMKAFTAETMEATRQGILLGNAYKAFGLSTRDELQKTARDLRQHYNDLLAVGFKSEADRKASLQRVLDAERAAAGETVSIWRGWSQALDGTAQLFQQLAQISDGSMSQVARSVGTAIGTVGQLGDAIDVLASDTSTNLQKMGAAFNAFTSLVSLGQLTVQIVESFQDPEWLKILRSVGRTWGFEISQGMATQIEESGRIISRAIRDIERAQGDRRGFFKSDPGVLRPHIREWAALLELTGAIKEAGGLNAANLDTWIERARGLFEIIQLGGQAGEEATRELNTAIELFAAQADNAGGLWSAAFRDLVNDAKATGREFDGLTKLIDAQLSKVAAATQQVASGLTFGLVESFRKLSGISEDDAGEVLRKSKDPNAELSDDERTRLELIRFTNQQIVLNYQNEYDRISRITLASFNAQIAQGKSAVEAMQNIGPAVDQLIAAAERFGFAGGAAFDQLSRWRELTTHNAPLLEQVVGLNELMTALSNLGAMNAETFADLQAQGLSTYQSLIAAGFTEAEARMAIKPLIETEIRLAKEKNLTIDEGTQKIIDQMRANGELAEEQQSVQEILKEGFGALIKFFNADLPDGWKKFSKDAKDAADDVTKTTGSLAERIKGQLGSLKFKLPVEFDVSEHTPLPSIIRREDGGGSGTGSSSFFHVPGAASGGIALTPQIIGVGEAGPEAIIPLDRLTSVMDGTGAAAGRGMTVVFEVNGRELAHATVPFIPGEVRRLGLTRT